MMTKRLVLIPILLPLILAVACDAPEPLKTDAELGLNPVQARGHHIFDRQCASCHAAYSSHVYKGPSLKGMFRKPYLHTGAPANDDRVRQLIVVGHNKMPAFGRVLSDAQVDDLIAYLKTL